jgi:uncharacterized protein involved in exopolysaccharide biosynthesis
MNSTLTDIPLTEALRRVRKSRKSIIAFCLFGAIVGTIVAISTRAVYVGEVTLVPEGASTGAATAAIAKRLSGLASIAGISVGGQGNSTRDAALATLESYKIAADFLSGEGLEGKVVEAHSKRDLLALLGRKPRITTWEAVRDFREHMSVSQDKDTSLVHVSVEWYDPVSASTWANRLVALTDSRLRALALENARARLDYLQREMEKTTVLSIQQLIASMMEDDLKTLATAGADRNYAFNVIDPAVPADKPTRPKRFLIIVAFAFAGLVIGVLASLLSSHPTRN